MNTIIFDDASRVWNYGSPAIRVALHGPKPDFDLQRYVTDSLGFVALKRNERSAQLHLRPGITSPVGLAAALFALADDPPERLVVSHPDEACGDEVFVDIARAFDRIAELMDAKSPTEPARFLREEQRVDGLLRGETPLSLVLQRWCDQSAARHDPRADHELLDSMIHARFMIVESADAGLSY